MTNEDLRRLRKAKHLTQADLAQAIKCSRQAIIKWENDVHPIPEAMAIKITEVCVGELPTSNKPTKQDRVALEIYTKMRSDPSMGSHAKIVTYWRSGGFMPSPEAQQMIAEAFPDILKPSES